jgi:hypothetical protein
MSEELLPWTLQFQSAKTWMNTIRAENTKNMYLKHLKRYCDAVNKNPDELIEFKMMGYEMSPHQKNSRPKHY